MKNITAIYMTPCKDRVGTQCERNFASINDAKSAPPPAGHNFVCIQHGDGCHVYTPIWGWEFYTTIRDSLRGRSATTYRTIAETTRP